MWVAFAIYLTIKSGVKSLPVDIDQLFIDVFYYFYHSIKKNKSFVTSGALFLPLNLR